MSKKYIVTVNGKSYEVVVEEAAPGKEYAAAPEVKKAQPVTEIKKEIPVAAPSGNGTSVNAPLPGLVLKVAVTPGQKVKKGELLCVVEAMKMENDINSPVDGTVESVAAKQGSNVNSGELLLVIV